MLFAILKYTFRKLKVHVGNTYIHLITSKQHLINSLRNTLYLFLAFTSSFARVNGLLVKLVKLDNCLLILLYGLRPLKSGYDDDDGSSRTNPKQLAHVMLDPLYYFVAVPNCDAVGCEECWSWACLIQ